MMTNSWMVHNHTDTDKRTTSSSSSYVGTNPLCATAHLQVSFFFSFFFYMYRRHCSFSVLETLLAASRRNSYVASLSSFCVLCSIQLPTCLNSTVTLTTHTNADVCAHWYPPELKRCLSLLTQYNKWENSSFSSCSLFLFHVVFHKQLFFLQEPPNNSL